MEHIPTPGTIERDATETIDPELQELKASLQEDGSGTSHIAALVSLAKTLDQVYKT